MTNIAASVCCTKPRRVRTRRRCRHGDRCSASLALRVLKHPLGTYLGANERLVRLRRHGPVGPPLLELDEQPQPLGEVVGAEEAVLDRDGLEVLQAQAQPRPRLSAEGYGAKRAAAMPPLVSR